MNRKCINCKYWQYDMDMDPFCMHEEVIKEHPFGLYIDSAIKSYCGPELMNFEPTEAREFI